MILFLVHNLDFGSSLPKTILGPKLAGSGLGEHPKNLELFATSETAKKI